MKSELMSEHRTAMELFRRLKHRLATKHGMYVRQSVEELLLTIESPASTKPTVVVAPVEKVALQPAIQSPRMGPRRFLLETWCKLNGVKRMKALANCTIDGDFIVDPPEGDELKGLQS